MREQPALGVVEGAIMNRAWAQRWIKLFDGHTDELMELYAEDIRFEDVNLGVRIDNDKDRLAKILHALRQS
jgi:hypothetical protein